MFLVHEKKAGHGRWEVAWTWLPFFLASDSNLHKYVGQKMTEEFKGQTMEEDPAQKLVLLRCMHNRVLELILEKYCIPGLRSYLESTIHLQPEEEVTTP
jgi:hypothetical protein